MTVKLVLTLEILQSKKGYKYAHKTQANQAPAQKPQHSLPPQALNENLLIFLSLQNVPMFKAAM